MLLTKEAKTMVAYWLGIVVAVLTIAAYGRAFVDDRYVRKSAYRVDQVRDSAWKFDQHAITLDILCSRNVEPKNQRCLR